MKTLDRSRPYGTVCGDGESHRFEQDGLKFDAQGREVVAKGARPAAEAKAPEPQRTAVDDEIGRQTGGGEAVPPDFESMNKMELEALLAAASVEYPRNAKKEQLVKLCKQHIKAV